MRPRVDVACPNPVDDAGFYTPRIKRGSASLVLARSFAPEEAPVPTDVAMNGKSIDWSMKGSQELSVLIPASELETVGPQRVDIVDGASCRRSMIQVVDEGAARPELHVTPTHVPANVDSAAMTIVGGPFVHQTRVSTTFTLWRSIDDVEAIEAYWYGDHYEAKMRARQLAVAGEAWIYAVNPTGTTAIDVVVSGPWIQVHLDGTSSRPDIVDATPRVLSLGDPASNASLTLVARDRFTALTDVRARLPDGTEQWLGSCPSNATTCALILFTPTELTAQGGRVTLIASTLGVGEGAPFVISVENPTPHLKEGGAPDFPLTVSASAGQQVVLQGSGFVGGGVAAQRSFVVETTTGTKLEAEVGPTNLDIASGSDRYVSFVVPPALVQAVGTLQVHVVNPGAAGAGPALVSNSVPIVVRVGP